jgi:integrase
VKPAPIPEVLQLFRAVDAADLSAARKMLLLFSIAIGMHWSKLTAIQMCDLDIEQGEIVVGGRRHRMSALAIAIVREQLEGRSRLLGNRDLVFEGHKGRQMAKLDRDLKEKVVAGCSYRRAIKCASRNSTHQVLATKGLRPAAPATSLL